MQQAKQIRRRIDYYCHRSGRGYNATQQRKMKNLGRPRGPGNSRGGWRLRRRSGALRRAGELEAHAPFDALIEDCSRVGAPRTLLVVCKLITCSGDLTLHRKPRNPDAMREREEAADA